MEQRIVDKFVLFWGGIFSNFYPITIIDNAHDIVFSSSEQYFMYLKARYFSDFEIANDILRASGPKEAKKLGRKIKGFNDEQWAAVREQIMFLVVYEKFVQNETLRAEFLSEKYDGKRFVEASPFDGIWGIKLGVEDPLAEDESNWNGLNLLGKILDEVRRILKY